MSKADDTIKAHFKLRKPCSNCPFLKKGGIELAPGRLDGIVNGLLDDDCSTFHCHKVVHSAKTGGTWDEDGNYTASNKESMCAGAMIYLEKAGRPTVPMRLGHIFGAYSREALEPHFDKVIDAPADD